MKKILFVHSRFNVVRLEIECLEKYIIGLTVEYAGNANEALKKLKEKNYPVVIMDIGMNPADGWDKEEVAEGHLSGIKLHQEMLEICKRKKQAPPSIIVFTALCKADDELIAFSPKFYKQASDYFREFTDDLRNWLCEPIDPIILAGKVQEILQQC
ncbi:MAG: hypothetical protein V1684_02940 [bacterium]